MNLRLRFLMVMMVGVAFLSACEKLERGPFAKAAPAKPNNSSNPNPGADKVKETPPPISSAKALKVSGMDPKKLGSGKVWIASGAAHTCVGNEAGLVYCWGRNNFLQTGTVSNTALSTVPTLVKGLEGMTLSGLVAGDDHTCAITNKEMQVGQVRCWGKNNLQQLGYAQDWLPKLPSPLPPVGKASELNNAFQFSPLTDVQFLSAKGDRTCARIQRAGKNEVVCWGTQVGQAGGPVTPLAGTEQHDVSSLAVLGIGECFIIDEKFQCKGEGLDKIGAGLEGLVRQLSGGWRNVCAIVARTRSSREYSVKCFGSLTNAKATTAEAAHDDLPDDGVRYNVADLARIAAGHNHTCALSKGGKVSCWGDNEGGKAGVEKEGEVQNPVAITLPGKATALAAGELHTCAVLEDRSVYCWGDNHEGQLGIAPPPSNDGPSPIEQ